MKDLKRIDEILQFRQIFEKDIQNIIYLLDRWKNKGEGILTHQQIGEIEYIKIKLNDINKKVSLV